MQYFAGTRWACQTFAGSQETHVYVATGPGGFIAHIAFATASRGTIVVDEAYSFDATRPAWKAILGQGTDGVTSEEWSATDWVFTGRQTDAHTRVPFRVAYHMFGRRAFRRDFQNERNGKWIPYAGETCELTSN